MADDFTVRFELDVAAATQNANRLAQSLGQVTSALESAQAPAQQVAQSLDAVSTASNQRTRQAANSTRATKQMSDAELQLAEGLYNQSQAYQRVSVATKAAENNRKAETRSLKEVENAYKSLSTRAESVSKGLETTLGRADSGYIPTTFGQIEGSVNRLGSSLPTLRYAVYDVAATVGVLSAALLAAATATYAVSIAWERNFANVIRTLDPDVRTSSELINTLRQNFQDLAGTLPITSKELAEIGALAGQLGISARDMTSFTAAVAQFSATSDVTAEAAATAFGRLNALLPDVNGNFTALGSSILKVGVNSVAAESEIIAIVTQLSALAGAAGLSAGETVGLAGALASVGVRPELARGTITRLFTLIEDAASGSSDRLRQFADVAGVSADEFASAYGSNRMGGVLLQFFNGLNRINDEGGSVNQTLRELGLNSVRDRPAIARLATAMNNVGEAGQLVNQTFEDGVIGFSEAIEMSEQYSIISGTVAAKLQVLGNNWENLLVVLGQGGVIFGGLIDAANDFLRVLTDLARNPVAGVIAQVVLVGAGLLGVLGALATTALLGVGGLLAIVTAMNAVSATGVGTNITLAGINAQLATMGTVGRTAATSLGFLRGGLIGIAAVAGVGILYGEIQLIADSLQNLGYVVAGIDTNSVKSLMDALVPVDTAAGEVSAFGDELQGMVDRAKAIASGVALIAGPLAPLLSGVAQSIDPVNDLLGQLDDQLTNIAMQGDFNTVWSLVGEIADRNGVSIEQVLEKFPDLRAQLALTGADSDSTADAMKFMTEQIDEEATALANLALELGLADDELKNMLKSFQAGASQFVSYKDILKDLESGAKDTAQALADAENEWQGLKGDDKFVADDFFVAPSLADFTASLTQSNIELQDWATDLGILAGQGATNFVTGLAALGPEGAYLAAQAVNLTTDELFKLEEQAALAAFLASDAFAQTWASNNAALATAFKEGGIEAVRGMISAQIEESRSGIPGAVADFVSKWNEANRANPLTVPVGVELTEADRQIAAHKAMWEAPITKTVWLDVRGGGADFGVSAWNYHAAGGYISGPGTSTSDSIPARLSDGEYVIRAAAVRKYGTGMFDALNRGVAKFATGGQVGSGSSFPNSMVTEFGPQSMAAVRGLGGGGGVTVVLDDVAIAQAANRGNAKLVGQGVR